MGKSLRDDPTAVTAEMSGWLSNPDSPALWAPFAFSIRGLAYEVMDDCELARMDYIQGLNLYDTLMEELGEDVLQRMTNNMKFMRVRLEALPPAAVSPVESYSYFEQLPSETAGNMVVSTPFYQDKQVAPDDQAGENEATNEGEWQHEELNEKVDESVPEGIELDEHMGEDEAMGDGENQAEESDKQNGEPMPETTNQEKTWEYWEDDDSTEIAQIDAANEVPEEEHKDEEDVVGEKLAADGGMTGDVPTTQDQASGEE